jgi:hypothetical protein
MPAARDPLLLFPEAKFHRPMQAPRREGKTSLHYPAACTDGKRFTDD